MYLLKSQRFLQFVLGILKNWVGVLMQRGKTQYCAKVLCYPYFLISRRQTSLLFLKWNWTIVLQTFQRNFNVCIFCCFQSSPRICILFIRMFVLLFVCFFFKSIYHWSMNHQSIKKVPNWRDEPVLCWCEYILSFRVRLPVTKNLLHKHIICFHSFI